MARAFTIPWTAGDPDSLPDFRVEFEAGEATTWNLACADGSVSLLGVGLEILFAKYDGARIEHTINDAHFSGKTSGTPPQAVGNIAADETSTWEVRAWRAQIRRLDTQAIILRMTANIIGSQTDPVPPTGIAAPNTVYAGPSSGTDSGDGRWRRLVAADLPDLSGVYIAQSGTTTFGRALLALSNAAALASAAGLGTGDSPTFAGLTVSGGMSAGVNSFRVNSSGSLAIGEANVDHIVLNSEDGSGAFDGPVTASNLLVSGTSTISGIVFSGSQIYDSNGNILDAGGGPNNINLGQVGRSVSVSGDFSVNGLASGLTPSVGDNTTNFATTAFVQAALVTIWKNKGDLDCSGNPNYPPGLIGDTYRVSVAGKIGGASGASVDAGDVVSCKADNAGGTQASVGSSWYIIEHNLVGALLAANNLSDLSNAGTARTNLGLGTAAVINVGANVAAALAIGIGSAGAVIVNGGTATGMTLPAAILSGVIETGVNLSATMSGTVTANYAAGDYQYGTISGALTLVFSNPPSSDSVGTLTLELTGDGTHAITWPTSVDWGTAGAPATLGSGSCTIFTFITRNAGTKWRAAYVGGFA